MGAMERQTDPTIPALVRPATEADLPAILDIYNHAVLHSTATFDEEPRALEDQRRWLREHAHPYAVVVAVSGDRVAGWASLSPFHARPAYRFTAEDSVYVHPEHRGRGIGGLLLAELLSLARGNGFHTVVARITGGNDASVRLHARLGFEHAGTEREVGYKFGQWLDVTVMQAVVDR